MLEMKIYSKRPLEMIYEDGRIVRTKKDGSTQFVSVVDA